MIGFFTPLEHFYRNLDLGGEVDEPLPLAVLALGIQTAEITIYLISIAMEIGRAYFPFNDSHAIQAEIEVSIHDVLCLVENSGIMECICIS